MVRVFGTIALLAVCAIVNAQEKKYVMPGLMTSGLTISPSKMLNHATTNFYLTGFSEYYVDEHISFKGAGHLFVNEMTGSSVFKNSIRGYFGTAYHFGKKNWRQHIGFYPGLNVVELSQLNPTGGRYPTKLMPSVSIDAGTTLHIWKFLNFYATITYVHSRFSGTNSGAIKTDELMFSAGLGFQVPTWRTKRKS